MPYIHKTTKQYPISEQDIRSLNPNTSFPSPFMAPDTYALVFPAPQPAHDPLTQSVREIAPVFTVKNIYEQAWEVIALEHEQAAENQARDVITKRKALLKQIDDDADVIYAQALGNRATEYAQAEADATAYKAAGYIGAVPGYVQAWAAATGKSATWATDDILATSAAWRTAMAAIRLNRLGRKEDARKAVDASTLTVVKAQWDGFVTAITAQLGV